jgi:hypothetical protein
MNINHFKDLSKDMQVKLLDFISEHFSKRPHFITNHTAYGMKQKFTALAESNQHVTSRCFMEAMVQSGYETKILDENASEDSKDWIFNAYVKKSFYKANS